MSSINGFKLFAIMLVSAMLVAMAVPAAFAEEKTTGAHAGSAVPDVTVILGSTGGSVGGANVYLDGSLAGKTDSKGNFTFKEAPAAGNHTIMVSAKSIKNATVEANFAEKPVVVNKADNALDQKIKESASPEAKFDVPATLKDTFACKDSKVQVVVDAGVIVPDAKEFPVVDVVPDEITTDFVKTAVQVLFAHDKNGRHVSVHRSSVHGTRVDRCPDRAPQQRPRPLDKGFPFHNN
jgi:hypothetical protein